MGIPNIPVTLPQLPVLNQVFAQPGQSSQFDSAHQAALEAFSNPITAISTTVVSNASLDLINAEQTMISNNTTINNLLNNLLAFGTIGNNQSQVQALQSILANPNNFILGLPGIASINTAITNAGLLITSNQDTLNAFLTNVNGYISALPSISTIVTEISTATLNTNANQLLLASILADPTTFIENLFPSNDISKGVTSKSLIKDLFVNPGNVPADFQAIITPGFTTYLAGLFPSKNTSFASGTSPSTIINDLLVVNGGNVKNLGLDILNTSPLSDLSNFSGLLPFGDWITGLAKNASNLGVNCFVGDPFGLSTSGKLQYVTNFLPNSGQEGITFSSGSGFGGVGGYMANMPNDGLPGVSAGSTSPFGFGGYLGFSAAASLMATSELRHVIHNDTNIFGGNIYSDASHLADAVVRSISGGVYAGVALLSLVEVVGQLLAMIQNISNVLTNSGIPVGPINFASGTSSTLTAFKPAQF